MAAVEVLTVIAAEEATIKALAGHLPEAQLFQPTMAGLGAKG